MTRALALLLGLLLLALPASSQQVPDPISRSELGTIRSEGGTAPNADASTRFYGYASPSSTAANTTYNYGKIQFEVKTDPDATDWAIEQAGKAGQGATRVCQTSVGTTADCNYVSRGWASRHIFGNGAGGVAEFAFRDTGLPIEGDPDIGYSRGWPKLVGRNDATAEITAGGTTNVNLELRPKGTNTAVHVGLPGSDTPVSGSGRLTFVASSTSTQPSRIESADHGVRIIGQRISTHKAHGNSPVSLAESGVHYHNTWLPGDGTPSQTTLTLPLAAPETVGIGGGNWCFAVDEPQMFTIQAAGTDKIAIGATNSIAGGKIQSNQPYASICLETHKTGQWFATSTPDKTQWTVL